MWSMFVVDLECYYTLLYTVYCGNQSQSYHATTILAVQPLPDLKVNCLHIDTNLPLSLEIPAEGVTVHHLSALLIN